MQTSMQISIMPFTFRLDGADILYFGSFTKSGVSLFPLVTFSFFELDFHHVILLL